jgi:hypothetical protein
MTAAQWGGEGKHAARHEERKKAETRWVSRSRWSNVTAAKVIDKPARQPEDFWNTL